MSTGGEGSGGPEPEQNVTPTQSVTPTPSFVGQGILRVNSSIEYTSPTGTDRQTEDGNIAFIITRQGDQFSARDVEGSDLITWTDMLFADVCSFTMRAETSSTLTGTVYPSECKMEFTISARYTSGELVDYLNCPMAPAATWPGGVSTIGPATIDLWKGAEVRLGGTETYNTFIFMDELTTDSSILCFHEEVD